MDDPNKPKTLAALLGLNPNKPKTLAALLGLSSSPPPEGIMSPPPASPQGLGGLLSSVLRQPAQQAPASNPVLDEMQFRQWIQKLPWFSEFQKQYGEAPNIAPGGDYDYRAAYKAGIVPVQDPFDNNRYHWPSSTPDGRMLKSQDHPTAWKEHFMRETGQNPDALGLRTLADAAVWKFSRKR